MKDMEGKGNQLPNGLAKPAIRALAGVGIHQTEQIAQYTERELAELHGIGPNALKQIKIALAEKGLNFRSSII